MFHPRSRTSAFKLAGVGAMAATVLATAPSALAASTGGAPVTPSAAAANASAPFTIGLSSSSAKPGAKLTISGLAYARAGLNLTIASDAISSARDVKGVPAVQTPALVEGIYHTTVRVPPATEPGVYSVVLSFNSRQVASTRLRVVAANSSTGGSTRLDRCAGIGFTVLHNDRAGSAHLPAGAYTVSSSNMDCGTASADFTSFLAGAGKSIAGWNTTSPAAGRATFSQRNSGLSFSVAKNR
jgi:hypothetical protein